MKYSDADLDKIADELRDEAEVKREKRREMKSGQIKKTLWGNMKFMLIVDLPADLPEDNFKKYMTEYGQALKEAFSG